MVCVLTYETARRWPLQLKCCYSLKKTELVQVRSTLSLRDQESLWMHQDGCKVYMDSFLHGIKNGSCFMVTWIIFENYLLEVGLTQNPIGRPWHFKCSQPLVYSILFYHVWGPAWTEIQWNSTWSRAWSHMASDYTWGSVATLRYLRGVLGWRFYTFFWAITISG